MTKIESVLSYLKKYVKQDASTPKIIDGFWSKYIQTKYPSLNQTIEISYSWGNFEIVKTEDGNTVFQASIKDNERSNMAELLVKDVYETIYVRDSEK